MTLTAFISRSLKFHARAHLGVVLGAAVGSAALIGALVVGDSVRGSLEQMALLRLGNAEYALTSADRFFQDHLADALSQSPADARSKTDAYQAAPILFVPGTAARTDGQARANQVQVLGLDDRLLRLQSTIPDLRGADADTVILNEALAAHLKAKIGDTVVLRVHKPSLLSRESPISPQEDYSVALRLKIQSVATDEALGRFNLHATQVVPFNAFVPLPTLQKSLELDGRANLLLIRAQNPGAVTSSNALPDLLQKTWRLADAELELREVTNAQELELRSRRVFLDDPTVQAAEESGSHARRILTYFVNELRLGQWSTPYSMVTATDDPRLLPEDTAEDGILLNQWLADDLQAKAGDKIALTYFVPGTGQRLEEKKDSFIVQSILPLEGPAADRSLMPDFPGIAKAERTENWDAGFPIQMSKIRPKDEKYWEDHRGTPKAFLPLPAGQRMWSNRFGSLTAMRWAVPPGTTLASFKEEITAHLLSKLNPVSLGFQFLPVRQQALAGARQSQDFGGLFIGFSFFLILAALILMALLFQFGLEQRLNEIGTLLALGFTPRRVRRLLLTEGAILALAGGVLGVIGGIVYAKTMLYGLTTLWRDAVGTSSLHFHVTPQTLVVGLLSAAVVSTLTIALVLRKQARRPARELLAEGAGAEEQLTAALVRKKSKGAVVGWIGTLGAAGIIGWALSSQEDAAESFFGAGSLLLIGGIGFAAWFFTRIARGQAIRRMTVAAMGLRSITRQRKRSLASVALLASGSFMIIAVGANRLDADLHAERRSSGTGGFAFLGESTLPVLHDLNASEGRQFFGLEPEDLADVSVVPMRVRDGDEASCLNLNRAQKPRLLGVNPELLDERDAFTFAKIAADLPGEHPWLLLRPSAQAEPDVIPAIGDFNSILWAMGKKVGDTLDYTDERGRPFKVRLVGAVANSILQGSLLIDEQEFRKRFPGEAGYRMFLIDAPSNNQETVAATLSRALQDAGLELTPTAQRLAQFNAVQNTYLNTFQVLGGLGLLLGSVGLGVVVLRNVLERRGELALLQAVGFRRRRLEWMVLSEHAALLGLGLIIGVVSALISILPVLARPGSELPLTTLSWTLAGVLASGLLWTWLATRLALRGHLLPALRNE